MAKQPTAQEEKFIQAIIRGDNQTEAYVYAYPHAANWQRFAITKQASTIMKKPHVKARYEELLAEIRERELEKTQWTREMAIEELRFLVDTNRKDIERRNEAFEQETAQLMEAYEKAIEFSPEDGLAYMKEIIESRKQPRATLVNNNGLLAAVNELNKMHGFAEQTINLNGSVVFTGEEELED